MEIKVKNLVEFLNKTYPEEYQEEWDNSGGQIIFEENSVESILIGMDISDEIVEYAIKNNVNLIITHHPFIFKGINKITKADYKGKLIIKLIQNEISVYSSHTNLDIADDGVNDELAKILELNKVVGLSNIKDNLYLGRVGENSDFKDVFEIKKYFEEEYNFKNIKIYGRLKNINRISLCGGAGEDLIRDAIKNRADILITGDVKYHMGQFAYENNILLMDLGHFNSEKFILNKLKNKLEEEFKIKCLVFDKNIFEITC